MTVSRWLLETGRQTPRSVRQFLSGLYRELELDAMLAPGYKKQTVLPTVYESPDLLGSVDPFAPIMMVNSARLVADRLQAHPGKRFAAVLRACEIRALGAIVGNRAIALDNFTLIGVDCLGTFTEEEFKWRGGSEKLTREVLRFARQGGVAMYRYRPACQMCRDPIPSGADLTIDILGLPAQTRVIISVHSPHLQNTLDIAPLVTGQAPEALVVQHDQMRECIQERRNRAFERITQALETDLVMTVDGLIDHLADCETCQACLNVCPIYSTGQVKESLNRKTVIDWLLSCAGCGMCEQSCHDHLPLTAIFRYIQSELEAALRESPAAT